MDINYNVPHTFPRQKLTRSEKSEDWGKQNIDFIISLTSFSTIGTRGGGRNDYQRMKVNYDLYNNIIDKDDFNYVTNPYGIKEEFPARLENYNIITPKLKLLEGEEIKRPFNFRFVATNSEAVSQIQEKKKELLLQYLEAELEQGLIAQGLNVQNPQSGEVMTPPQIEKYMSYSEADIRESTANKLGNYLIKKEDLEYKFNKGFKDALIAAREVYYIGIEGGEPVCRSVNTLDFDCDKNPDEDWIQNGQWACETKFCTPSEVIDDFYDVLSEGQVAQLDSGNFGNILAGKMAQGPATGPIVPTTYTTPTLENSMRNGYIRVTRVEWKSLRKIGFLTYYDEEFKKQEKIVDETYKPVKEEGQEVEWAWINEVWEGTKIGNDIYVRIKPKTVQYRSVENPSLCKLGYVGTIYNDRNSIPVSIVDLVKRHQYLYNIIVYRLELEVAKAKGKKMVMDIAQVPRSQGIDLEKWMYYFDTLGIAFVNSFEEGKGKFAGMTSQFNQFTGIDMTLSQSIQQYINIMIKLEDMVSELMGVSKQRLGAISSTETVGGVERSVQQSSNITEPLFYVHNEVKKHVLTQLIECAKVAYPENKKISFLLDDMQRVFLEISEEFINADYGVFVTNSAKEVKALEDLKMLAQQAISAGMITLNEAVTIIQSDSISEVKNIVKQAEAKQQAEKQQEQAAAEQLQAQASEQMMQLEEMKADRLDNREIIKGDIQKELAYIKTFVNKNTSPTEDTDGDGVPQILEYDRLRQEDKQHNDKINLERQKMKNDREIADKKLEIEKIKANKPKPSSK